LRSLIFIIYIVSSQEEALPAHSAQHKLERSGEILSKTTPVSYPCCHSQCSAAKST